VRTIEQWFESLIFASRWLLAPFFLGLIISIVVLFIKFATELGALVWSVVTPSEHDTVISILTLVDTSLIAILLLIIVFGAYESFVSKIDVGEHEDRPVWMGTVGFADLKIKLLGAIIAISAVELLKAFLVIDQYSNEQLAWKIGIHLALLLSLVFFALADWIGQKGKNKSADDD